MKITLLGYIYIAVTTIVILIGLAIRSLEFCAIAFSMLAIAIWRANDIRMREAELQRIDVRREVAKIAPQELEEIEIRIYVRNDSDSVLNIVVEDVPPPTIEPLDKYGWSIALKPNEEVVARYRAKPLYPGLTTFNKVVIELRDWLDLFKVRREVDCFSEVVVMPIAIRSQYVEKVLSSRIGMILRGRARTGLYDLENIREYIPGDDVRRIVWKHSAKLGKFMVREDRGEAWARILVIVFLDRLSWLMGEHINTWAHRLLRLARSIVEMFNRFGVAADIVMVAGHSARLIRASTIDRILFRAMQHVMPFVGASTLYPLLSLQASYPHLFASYDHVLFLLSYSSIAFIDPRDLVEFVATMGKPISFMLFFVREEELRDELRDLLRSFIHVVETFGAQVVIIDEEFKVGTTR